MKLNKKNVTGLTRRNLLSSLLFLLVGLSAFESSLYKLQILENAKGELPQFFQMTSNPTAFLTGISEDRTYYRATSFYRNNGLVRTFDPGTQNFTDLIFDFSRNLDDRSFINGGIRYTQTNLFDIFSSLEQDYYNNYFSLTDSTLGSVKYDGPRLWFQYDRRLPFNFIWGLNLEYGVERGLKDHYTECETIIRNNTTGTGLGYLSRDGNLFIGVNGNYSNRQVSYEAVGQYYDAQVYSFSGFNVITTEYPRSTVEKFEYNNGYEYGAQLLYRNILNRGLELALASSTFGREADIELGSTSVHNAVGYWVREGMKNTFSLGYHTANKKVSLQLTGEFLAFDDWARAAEFDVLILENSEQSTRYQTYCSLQGNVDWSVYLSAGFENHNIEYQEYIALFEYSETLSNNFYTIGINGKSGLLSTVHMSGTIGSKELDFHWDADKLDYWSVNVGVEQQFTFGILGVETIVRVAESDNEDYGAIQSTQLNLYVKR